MEKNNAGTTVEENNAITSRMAQERNMPVSGQTANESIRKAKLIADIAASILNENQCVCDKVQSKVRWFAYEITIQAEKIIKSYSNEKKEKTSKKGQL